MILREEIVALMDLNLSLEYRAVALRPEHLAASALREEEVLELIDAIEAFAEAIEIVTKVRPLSSDANDEMVLDVAINGRAEAIVTGNKKHFAAAGRRFEISILTPSEFLADIRSGGQNGD
jgi:predicted nucleic acid-binding protein